MSYDPAVSTADDEPKVLPILGAGDEKAWPIGTFATVTVTPAPAARCYFAPGDSRPDDGADKPATERPWLFIGRIFIQGIPGQDQVTPT